MRHSLTKKAKKTNDQIEKKTKTKNKKKKQNKTKQNKTCYMVWYYKKKPNERAMLLEMCAVKLMCIILNQEI